MSQTTLKRRLHKNQKRDWRSVKQRIEHEEFLKSVCVRLQALFMRYLLYL
jgi:hypothetical protein